MLLRKLTIFTFVVVLSFCFAAMAFAGTSAPNGKKVRDAGTWPAPSAKEIGPANIPSSEVLDRFTPDTFIPRDGSIQRVPGTSEADTSSCVGVQYTGFLDGAFNRFGGDPRELGIQYDIPAGHTAEISDVYIYIAGSSDTSTAGGCDPVDMELNIYADDGSGLPDDAQLVYSEVVLISGAAPFGGFWHVTLPAGVVVSNSEYFYTCVKSVGCAEEYVGFGIDATSGAGSRFFYRNGGVWYNYLALSGNNYCIIGAAEWCNYYSFCHEVSPLPAGYISAWGLPDPAWTAACTWYGIGQIFTAEGPDTLKSVRLRHNDYSDGYSTSVPAYVYPAVGGNDIIVKIWGDDGTGNIDEGAGPLATEVVSGRANIFPATGGDGTSHGSNYIIVDFSSYNLVLLGKYHITTELSTTDPNNGVIYFYQTYEGDCPGGPYCTDGSGASVLFTAPCDSWKRQSIHDVWAAEVGNEYGYWIRPTVCQDEFYECQNQVLYSYLTPEWSWWLDPATDWTAAAQKIVGTPVNRLEKFRVMVAGGENPVPAPSVGVLYTVWADGGASGPGAVLYQEQVFPTVLQPGLQEVVIPGGGLQILGDFYIGVAYDPATFDPADHYKARSEDGTTGPSEQRNGGLWVQYEDAGLHWINAQAYWGYFDNLFAEAEFCSIPRDERACFPQDDHVTFGFDMARTGASGLSIGDAWCDLNLSFHYEVTGKASIWSSPIIADGMAVASFTDNYQIVDLATSSVVGVLDIAHFGGDLFVVGNGVRCTPTVATIDSAGTPLRTLFISGGTTRTVSAIDFAPPFAKRWTSPVASGNFGAILPITPYGGLLVVNVGGEDVLIWHTQAGRVYASRADNGTLFAGWATNPLNLGGQINTAGCTDGTNIYYSTTDPDGGNPGDVYKIDAATGAILLQLSVDSDYQGDDVYGASVVDPLNHDEGWGGGMAYDDAYDILWTNSSVSGDFPTAGVFYSLNCSDFSINRAVQSHQEIFAAPILDQVRVYQGQGANWINPPLGKNMFAFRRPQGDLSYTTGGPSTEVPALYFTQAALSCEVGAPDLLFAFDGSRSGYVSAGFLSCFDADSGEELFRRRIENGTQGLNQGCGVALGNDTNGDTHLVTMDVAGNFYDFTKGVDRPRFEIQNYVPEAPVEFGPAPSVIVTLDDILYNSGCATLTIFAANIDTTDTGTDMPEFAAANGEVRPDVLENASSIAERLASNKLVGSIESVDPTAGSEELIKLAENSEKGYTNSSAAFYGLPWLNGYTFPATIGAGSFEDITIDVNQAVLDRGPHTFYLTFETDDPDFFLNDNSILPQMLINIVGGCLIDTTTLEFGIGGANYRWVTNTARLGTGDWDANGWEIDGDGDSYYQGSYIYGVNKYRLAMNSQDWTSGGGEAEGFFSAQGDPNWCDNSCAPFLVTSCQMGEMSFDGTTYTPVTGNMICATWVDSVQSYYDAGDATGDGWTWDGGWDTDGAFDDTLTIGLTVDQKSFGAVDADGLTNFTLDLFTFTERNGDSVKGWYFGSFHDYDAAGADAVDYSAAISSGWQGGTTDAWGQTKLPFGCGITPMKNSVSMFGHEGLWDSDPYYDSAYFWMSTYNGAVNHPATGDFQAHHTFVGHDFGPNESFTTATISFGLTTLTNGHDPAQVGVAAYAANKWIGFGRGDIDNDNQVTIADVVYLNAYVADPGTNPGPIPFMHLGDVDADGDVDIDDVLYLKAYYFECGPCPLGDWAEWLSCAP